MNPYIDAGKRALATFVFSTTGVLIGMQLLDADVETWKAVLSTGLGSLINLAYRASERWLHDNPEHEGGQSNAVLLVLFLIGVFVGAVMHANGWLFD